MGTESGAFFRQNLLDLAWRYEYYVTPPRTWGKHFTYHCATCQQLFEDMTEQAYEMTQQIYIMYDSLFVSGFIVMYSLMRYDDLYV